MNKIINNFLVEEKLMPEMHIKQPDLLDKSGFSYSTWGPFTKNKERIQKLKKKKTRDSRYIYRNELDKDCFQHKMPYGYFEDLSRRTVSDKVLKDKIFNITRNPNTMDIKKFLIKRLLVVVLNLCQIKNQLKNFISQLLENFKKEEFILHLKTIFGVVILKICN